MDLFPLWNSLRIALISSVIVFFAGIFAAEYITRLSRGLKGFLDVVLTLPLVLPPTVVGYFLLCFLGPNRLIGEWVQSLFQIRLTMVWYAAIFASSAVAFPLMYRTARGAFEAFDPALKCAAQTLGLSDAYIFWRIKLPCCRSGVLAGTVLAFARALGEYGATSMIAGYTPGRTATVSTAVYHLWRTGSEVLAFKWALINIAISFAVLMAVNFLEKRRTGGYR
ncbi:molybdate ABC transporter permease subunit [bacterium]|nr:molybdate ABC transporter permease subunit [bacterium]